jgi:uncharacterized phage infection (PIP) family protein YhgE
MGNSVSQLITKVKAYKNKYYRNLILKGSIFTFASLLSAYLLINVLEYFGNFSSGMRVALLIGFVGIVAGTFYIWILSPFLKLFNQKSQLQDEQVAQQIGEYFPTVKDKLLNVLQLQKSTKNDGSLAQASIQQKASQLENIEFKTAIKYEKNRRYLPYLVPPFLLFSLILLFVPQLFTQSTERIIKFDEDFTPQAPFEFVIQNEDFKTFKNENFEVKLNLEGKAIPANVYLLTERGKRLKMEKVGDKEFVYQFKKVQRNINLHFEALNFESQKYEVEVLERPNLSNFTTYLEFPRYLGKSAERLDNTGNLIIPEGTKVKWEFRTKKAESLNLIFNQNTEKELAKSNENGGFEFSKTIKKTSSYQIELENKYSKNKDKIAYLINVVPDQYPEINLEKYQDSVLYEYLILGGSISDDYGISKLELSYKIVKADEDENTSSFKKIPLKFNRGVSSQEYFYQLNLSDYHLKQGDKLEYFVQVWDNDGVNGSKSSKTAKYEFALPDQKAFKEEVSKATSKTEKQIEKTIKKADELQKNLEDLQNRMRGKKKLSWQDKKAIEELLKKQKDIEKELEEIAKKNENLNEKQKRFEEQDERIAEKSEQLQKLMDELLDEETQKLMEELKKLLEENKDADQMQETLEQMDKQNENMEKELERALEMFKQLKMENKMEDISKQLEELAEKQEELAEETKKMDEQKEGKDEETKDNEEQKEGEESKENEQENKETKEQEEVKKEQEKLNEEFEDIKKEMDELNEMNEDLKNKKDMEDFNGQEKAIEQKQEQSLEQLEQNENQKAQQSQQEAAEQMEQMAEEMKKSQQSMEQAQAQEDYHSMRGVLENLITLSFNQEKVMVGFRKINQRDPNFIKLSQEQLKLKDDAKVVEDSLYALAERVFQIESFVTRELGDMKDYMGQSVDAIKKRRPDIASAKQQMTMTSINNLALLLNDVLSQMQQSMGQSMSGKQNANQKGEGKPSLGDMQKQLNQQIGELKKSGKSGKELSKGLAKLAAQQEMLRRALQKSMQGQKKEGKDGKKKGEEDGDGMEGGGSLGKLLKEMEKTEEDLVNKRLTRELIERQKQILTRLLEAENADRERDLDKKREANKAKEKKREVPPEFSDYLKIKEKQIELLKTIPASLQPYYKREVNEYFKKLKN